MSEDPKSAIGTDHLKITTAVLDDLKIFLQKEKFRKEPGYSGAHNAIVRQRSQSTINLMVRELLAKLPQRPQKSFVLLVFKKYLQGFNLDDTEEREQAAAYCERVMDILSIESSDGVLNAWLYGFDPAKLEKK